MAANEHKNLSDINRHNPKGFENANNETVLSKTIGSSITGTDGDLVWQSKAVMGSSNYKMQGYSTGTLNYQYGVDLNSLFPLNIDDDYGSSIVSGGSLAPSAFFRMIQGYVIPKAANVTSINGWVTSNGAGGQFVTIAICKVTPVAGITTSVTPIVIDEITLNLAGLTGDNSGVSINESTITSAPLAVGDIIFPMIKESAAGSLLYFNLSIQTTTF